MAKKNRRDGEGTEKDHGKGPAGHRLFRLNARAAGLACWREI
jgi:hypothetical protein